MGGAPRRSGYMGDRLLLWMGADAAVRAGDA
jgi:hypothetical protein